MFVVLYTVNLYIYVLMTYSTSCCLYDTLWTHGIYIYIYIYIYMCVCVCVCARARARVCVSTTVPVVQVPGFALIFIIQLLFLY